MLLLKEYLAQRLASLTPSLAQQRSPDGGGRPRRKLPSAEAGRRPGGQRRSVPPVADGLLRRLAGPHGRPLLANGLEGLLKASEAPGNPGPPKVADEQPSAARGGPPITRRGKADGGWLP